MRPDEDALTSCLVVVSRSRGDLPQPPEPAAVGPVRPRRAAVPPSIPANMVGASCAADGVNYSIASEIVDYFTEGGSNVCLCTWLILILTHQIFYE